MSEKQSVFSAARSWLSRKLAPGTQTYVAGGGTDIEGFHDPNERKPERLEEYENIYERGGPVAALVDTRALMTFGTGAEFATQDDDEPVALVEGETVTLTDWLGEAFGDIDNLLVQIAKDAYIYGDALGELVETRGGGFSHVQLVNPKTMEPFWDDHGRIHRWRNEITRPDGEKRAVEFMDDEIAHFRLQTLGRSPLGVSLVEQNYDEIKRFARNQEAIENAMRLHGFPKYHVKVGREDAGAVPDRDLRRVRNRTTDFNEKTNFVTGRDIEFDVLDTAGFEVEGLAEHDLMILSTGFMVPEEMAGLGRGSTEATAKVRLQAFERNARSEQRILADQFIEQVVRPVLDMYSPFNRDASIELSFGDVVSDQTSTAEWLKSFEDYYTVNEVREKLGDDTLDGEELEKIEEQVGASDESPFGDFFGTADEGGGLQETSSASATPQETEADRQRSVNVERQNADGLRNDSVPDWVKRGEVRRDGGR